MKQINGIIMQYFEWYMNCNQNLWNEISQKAEKLADMGITCLRMSINWSRIYPHGIDEKPNEEGLQFYDDVFVELKNIILNH